MNKCSSYMRNFSQVEKLFPFFFVLLFLPFLPGRECFLREYSVNKFELNFRDSVVNHEKELQNISKSGHATVHTTSCACYEIHHPYCCFWQPLCICDNVCYDGASLVTSGGQVFCKEGVEAVPNGPLKPIPCRDKSRWEWALSSIGKENLSPILSKPENWLRERREMVEWREGNTFLQAIKRDSTNVAHFLGKVMTILLANNCTAKALTIPVDRFALPRHNLLVERVRKQGSKGFHATILANLLSLALQPVYGSHIRTAQLLQPHRFLGDSPMAYGLVEFEEAFKTATEQNPLCFNKAIMPSALKSIAYAGGKLVAELFTKELQTALKVNPLISKTDVRLMWIRRDPMKTLGRRAFTAESVTALENILRNLDFLVFDVQFDGMPFVEQFSNVQSADVILSMHGAGLTNPGTFGRQDSVIIEIMPYRINHLMYYMKATASGITYMLHQCFQGKAQPLDSEFSQLSYEACEMDKRCKHYFTHERQVDLSDEDLEEIEKLLVLAKKIARDVKASGTEVAGKNLLREYAKVCKGKKKEPECRQTVVRSFFADQETECIVSGDCST